jgi:hypothetical protein
MRKGSKGAASTRSRQGSRKLLTYPRCVIKADTRKARQNHRSPTRLQRRATCSNNSVGCPYVRRRRSTMEAACCRRCSALIADLPEPESNTAAPARPRRRARSGRPPPARLGPEEDHGRARTASNPAMLLAIARSLLHTGQPLVWPSSSARMVLRMGSPSGRACRLTEKTSSWLLSASRVAIGT